MYKTSSNHHFNEYLLFNVFVTEGNLYEKEKKNSEIKIDKVMYWSHYLMDATRMALFDDIILPFSVQLIEHFLKNGKTRKRNDGLKR